MDKTVFGVCVNRNFSTRKLILDFQLDIDRIDQMTEDSLAKGEIPPHCLGTSGTLLSEHRGDVDETCQALEKALQEEKEEKGIAFD